MMKRMTWTSAALAALTILGTAGTAMASSHSEAPAIGEDPRADNTDLYAWVEGQNLVILANYIPLEEPAAGPNWHKFSDDVLYEVHIARGPNSLNDALTYQIRFSSTPYPVVDPANMQAPVGGGKEFFSQLSGSTQTYSVTKLVNGQNPTVLVQNAPVAPPNVGPRTNSIAYQIPMGKTYEQFFVDEGATSVIRNLSGGEGRVFAGPRDDGFGVDLGAVFDLAGLETVLNGTPYDNVSGYNVHTIALEIPLAVANGGTAVVPGTANDNQTIGVWASASRRKTRILRRNESSDNFGPWVQVSRLGLPLINEAVIGIQDKDKFNRTHPKDDVVNFGAYILNPVIVRDAEFAGFYAAGGPLAACPGGPAGLKSNRTDILDVISLNGMLGHNITAIGDVLRVDLGIPSQFPNGRKVNKGTNKEEDVTDVELSLLLCKLAANVPDGVDTNDATFKSSFPYLAPPWEGSTRGKGE
ncbi:DUF4331 domain-containing protein [Polyangium sp. y55x31]|uniref:DUF4331 domain-containing protein n=1 Tax=Polyangium sp. y55x31 TaxID=3042688 RepID=UPI002482A1D7|nr:DUF4331 domain-containing protein [Polyangium sp. y55x31]MDI1484695.1 DUF4331 domain-containing protein [Polyangium sp. y55x31]